MVVKGKKRAKRKKRKKVVWWCREVCRVSSQEQQQGMYCQLVQALKAAHTPLEALPILEVNSLHVASEVIYRFARPS